MRKQHIYVSLGKPDGGFLGFLPGNVLVVVLRPESFFFTI